MRYHWYVDIVGRALDLTLWVRYIWLNFTYSLFNLLLKVISSFYISLVVWAGINISMLIETYGVIVKKSEFLSYNA